MLIFYVYDYSLGQQQDSSAKIFFFFLVEIYLCMLLIFWLHSILQVLLDLSSAF